MLTPEEKKDWSDIVFKAMLQGIRINKSLRPSDISQAMSLKSDEEVRATIELHKIKLKESLKKQASDIKYKLESLG